MNICTRHCGKTFRGLFVSRCFALLFFYTVPAFIPFKSTAQTADSIAKTRQFTGAVTFTTKGLSTFPNLTLGKPAAILDLSMGGEKFRFEPQLRFSLEGKPWTFIFWSRYQIVNHNRFQLKIGAHPAYSFKTVTVIQNDTEKEVLRAQQFLAGEISPVFRISENFSLGPYYIYSRGLEKDIVQNSNFISFRVNFTNISLGEKYFMRLMAQIYYLKMDDMDGFYVNSTLSLNRHNFPFSVSSTVNKAIETTIPGDDFLWNINLTYSFGGKYRKS